MSRHSLMISVRKYCGALALCAMGLVGADRSVWAYKIHSTNPRWTATLADGAGLNQGDATTVSWSIVPDGESYSRGVNSELIVYLDDGWDVAPEMRTPELTNRPWWQLIDSVFDQFVRVSGLDIVYVAEQDEFGSDTFLEGDIRIGGKVIDNLVNGVLADTAFPNNGDIRVDTTRDGLGKPSTWHSALLPQRLRNLMSHEIGHSMGLDHETIDGANALMEATLQTAFWGLQFDDIAGLNRNYGDPLERNGGNDSAANAYDLGTLAPGESVVLGVDAADAVVEELDGDWIGIDGASDQDWFRWTVAEPSWADLRLRPLGPVYSSSQGPGTNYAAQSDLRLLLVAGDGSTSIMELNDLDAGSDERIERIALQPGDFFVRVDGMDDANQFYQLELAAGDSDYAPPADLRQVFADSFTVAGGSSSDVNLDRFTSARQLSGLADSWIRASTSIPEQLAVEIVNDRLEMATVSDGGVVPMEAHVALARNFAPEVGGGRWELSFDLSVTGDATVDADAFFALLIGDESSGFTPSAPWAGLAITVDQAGTIVVRDDDQAIGTGTFDAASVELSIVVDERSLFPTLDVLIDGSPLVSAATLSWNGDDLARYVGMVAFLNAGQPSGASFDASVDDMAIRLLNVNPQGADFDSDGDVDDVDFAIWQTAFTTAWTGDADGDMDSDGDDFLSWQREFSLETAISSAGAAAVPEPTTVALTLSLLVASWLVIGRAATATPAIRRASFALAAGGIALAANRNCSAQLPVPPGLNPGDRYHLAFNSSSITQALPSNIAFYNGFVQTVANNAGLGASQGVTWFAIASTATTDARDNALVGADTPVYNMQLEKLADGFDDLWDGDLDGLLRYNELGQLHGLDPWTGSMADGTKAPGLFLGGPSLQAYCGRPAFSDERWTSFITPPTNSALPLYALSEELVVLPWADFDSDGFVAGGDFLTWQRGIGRSNADFLEGDANGDARVDAVDLAVWHAGFGSGAVVRLATIPEPNGWALAWIVASFVAASRAPKLRMDKALVL